MKGLLQNWTRPCGWGGGRCWGQRGKVATGQIQQPGLVSTPPCSACKEPS